VPPTSAPLAAIFLLSGTPGTHDMTLVSGAEACTALIPCTFASHLLQPVHRARELAALGELVANIPVWRLSPPVLPGGVGAFRDQIRRAAVSAS
jgi:hypothetical protein